ncbi:integrase/recombinase xerD homolog [Hydractinia symbiolongicarpus]|uniref:integrase/recombinase xerD homolog n=1 Tax=Hydractinia symbiolongicarpus TaxID=13093 RepID=UPI00254FD06C|nr:integrase/recombinase xerD homolog [Hydractinia symbiolongicarpus]
MQSLDKQKLLKSIGNVFHILELFASHFTQHLENETLRHLAEDLPEYILNSRANNTIKTYYYSFNSWNTWCQKYSVSKLPAPPLTVALYILNLTQMNNSYPKIEIALYAIQYFHNLTGYNNPCDHTLPKNMLEAAKRLLQHQTRKKAIITVEHLHALHKQLVKSEAVNLYKLRTFNIFLLGFCGFLRFSEISNLKRCDVNYKNSFMKLFIAKSKTDIYREGHWVYIGACGNGICPVYNLTEYMKYVPAKPDSYLFRAVTVTSNNKFGSFKKMNRPISYTTTRENALDALASIGLDRTRFGLHSLRAGAATAAANADVPDRLFKRHGRWRSETAKDGYVEDDAEHLLYVTRNLGL